MAEAIVWASCGLGPGDPVYKGFERLGSELRARGLRLVVFTPHYAGVLPSDAFEAIPIPLLLAEHQFSETAPFSDAETIEDLVELDSALSSSIGARMDETAASAVARACGTWTLLAGIMRPCAILSWHTSSPLSHLHRRLADRNRIPWWSLERGAFPETFDLSHGQSSQVDLATSASMLKTDRSNDYVDRRFEEIRRYYEDSVGRHYPAVHEPVSRERELELCEGTGPKVLFVGSHDVGSAAALSPPHRRRIVSERCSAFVGSSKEGALATLDSLADVAPESTLWIRPHPAAAFSIDTATGDGPRVIEAATDDLRWLITKADLIVGLLSTTQVYALLWEKPQVALADGHLSGRNILETARSPQDLRALLRKALTDADPGTRRKAGRDAITLLFDRQLIGLQERTPTRLTLADAADLIARFKSFAEPSSLSCEEKLAAASAILATPKKAPENPTLAPVPGTACS